MQYIPCPGVREYYYARTRTVISNVPEFGYCTVQYIPCPGVREYALVRLIHPMSRSTGTVRYIHVPPSRSMGPMSRSTGVLLRTYGYIQCPGVRVLYGTSHVPEYGTSSTTTHVRIHPMSRSTGTVQCTVHPMSRSTGVFVLRSYYRLVWIHPMSRSTGIVWYGTFMSRSTGTVLVHPMSRSTGVLLVLRTYGYIQCPGVRVLYDSTSHVPEYGSISR